MSIFLIESCFFSVPATSRRATRLRGSGRPPSPSPGSDLGLPPSSRHTGREDELSLANHKQDPSPLAAAATNPNAGRVLPADNTRDFAHWLCLTGHRPITADR